MKRPLHNDYDAFCRTIAQSGPLADAFSIRVCLRCVFAVCGLVFLTVTLPLGCRSPDDMPDQDASLIDLGDGLRFVRLPGCTVWFGTCEVANHQFRAFRAEHDSGQFHGRDLNDDALPVVNVSLSDARAYCRWLSKRYKASLPRNSEVRLPHVAEWESAAQCGTDREYPWGEGFPPTTGNYADQAFQQAFPQEPASHVYLPTSRHVQYHNDGFATAAPSLGVAPNEWGIRGLGGNVREWTADAPSVDVGRREVLRAELTS